jgi:glycosyltransferase involved in cell wall biosynthesis
MPAERHGDRPLRVLTMLDTLERVGGAESMALEICLGLRERGYDSYLGVTRWREELRRTEPAAGAVQRLESAGIPIVGIPRRGTLDVAPWRRFVRFLRSERIDVLHAHMFGSNAWGSLLGRLARTPVVVAHEHMWSFSGSPGRRFVDRWLIARLADAFVAVSEDARARMIEVERIPPSKLVVIRNGIPPLPPGDRAEARRRLGLTADAPVVLSVGMLRPEKAFDVLLEATAQLGSVVPPPVTLIAGEGPERARLERTIASLGIGERVRFLGARTDVPDLLAAADVCVCCSSFEGGPLSVMEYLAAGKPVVATRVGGLPELVEPGANGVLVAPGAPGQLAAAIAELLGDPGERERMGRRGRARFDDELSLARSLTEIEGLYARLGGPASG